MQPYILPYLGYWQLINESDVFVIYDDIQYTKKGWINRNRFSVDGKIENFTLPLRKDNDFLPVNERFFSQEKKKFNSKTLRKIKQGYSKSVSFECFFPIVERIFNYSSDNVFDFILNSVVEICNYLDIDSKIIKSSDIIYEKDLKSQEKVIEICRSLGSSKYINLSGGMDLYSESDFLSNGIELIFLRKNDIDGLYDGYIDNLSIIDLAFNLEKMDLKRLIKNEFEYIKGK